MPLKLEQTLIDKLKKELPELPDQKKERFIKEHNLSSYEANILVSEKEISEYYEEVIKECDKKLATNWITVELFAVLNKKNLTISQSPVSAKNLSALIKMITSGKISGKIAKDVFVKMQSGNKLQDALKSIFAIAENYPQLRANENFLHLQKELASIEDKVAYARQYYNDSIMSYENVSERIPGMLFFNLYGKKKKEYLKIPQEHKAVPKIEF